jgi:hypothetical protein
LPSVIAAISHFARFIPAMPTFVTMALTPFITEQTIDGERRFAMRNRIGIKTGVKAGDGGGTIGSGT